jgi:transposase
VGTKVDETLNRIAKGKRPNFPVETKRHLVEQTFEAGASVSLVARRNDVNTNLLFRWRRQYLQGVFGAPCPEHAAAASKPDASTTVLLPMSVVAEPSEATPMTRPRMRPGRQIPSLRLPDSVLRKDFD